MAHTSALLALLDLVAVIRLVLQDAVVAVRVGSQDGEVLLFELLEVVVLIRLVDDMSLVEGAEHEVVERLLVLSVESVQEGHVSTALVEIKAVFNLSPFVSHRASRDHCHDNPEANEDHVSHAE